jgi:DNA-binding NtrC family response regulator
MPETSDSTVYVVDDEQIIAFTLAAILKKSGFSAVAFTNPLDALKSSEFQPPSILISDVKMPEMNGVELAVRIKSRNPVCKVLLFSGHALQPISLDQPAERVSILSFCKNPFIQVIS